jgi:hypothetical protein
MFQISKITPKILILRKKLDNLEFITVETTNY